MLSLDDCRRILGPDAPDDDRELAERRDYAYRLARLLAEMYEEVARGRIVDLPQDPET
jgi:hypothetical protein